MQNLKEFGHGQKQNPKIAIIFSRLIRSCHSGIYTAVTQTVLLSVSSGKNPYF